MGLLPRRYRPNVSWRWVEVGGIVINGVVTHWFGKSCGVYVPNPRTACRVVPNSVFATDSLRGMCPRVKLITAVASQQGGEAWQHNKQAVVSLGKEAFKAVKVLVGSPQWAGSVTLVPTGICVLGGGSWKQ